jgi:hypothetical protein
MTGTRIKGYTNISGDKFDVYEGCDGYYAKGRGHDYDSREDVFTGTRKSLQQLEDKLDCVTLSYDEQQGYGNYSNYMVFECNVCGRTRPAIKTEMFTLTGEEYACKFCLAKKKQELEKHPLKPRGTDVLDVIRDRLKPPRKWDL